MRNKDSSSSLIHHSYIFEALLSCVVIYYSVLCNPFMPANFEFLTQMCHRRPNLIFIYLNSDVTNGLRQCPPSTSNKYFPV